MIQLLFKTSCFCFKKMDTLNKKLHNIQTYIHYEGLYNDATAIGDIRTLHFFLLFFDKVTQSFQQSKKSWNFSFWHVHIKLSLFYSSKKTILDPLLHPKWDIQCVQLIMPSSCYGDFDNQQHWRHMGLAWAGWHADIWLVGWDTESWDISAFDSPCMAYGNI